MITNSYTMASAAHMTPISEHSLSMTVLQKGIDASTPLEVASTQIKYLTL